MDPFRYNPPVGKISEDSQKIPLAPSLTGLYAHGPDRPEKQPHYPRANRWSRSETITSPLSRNSALLLRPYLKESGCNAAHLPSRILNHIIPLNPGLETNRNIKHPLIFLCFVETTHILIGGRS